MRILLDTITAACQHAAVYLPKRALSSRRGATAIEYGLIAAGVSVAIAGIVGTIGDSLVTTFNTIYTGLQ